MQQILVQSCNAQAIQRAEGTSSDAEVNLTPFVVVSYFKPNALDMFSGIEWAWRRSREAQELWPLH